MNAVMPREARCGIGLGIDDEDVGVRAVRDPHLSASEHVSIAAAFGAQLHRDDIRTRARLGHRERAHVLARYELRQVSVALLVACRSG